MKEERKSLKKLRKLTNTLADLQVNCNSDKSKIQFEAGPGKCMTNGLYKVNDVAVLRASFSKGSTIPEHQHKTATEFFILYEGKLKIECDGEEWIVSKLDHFKVVKGKTHTITALEDTLAIFVTIPADKNYPETRR